MRLILCLRQLANSVPNLTEAMVLAGNESPVRVSRNYEDTIRALNSLQTNAAVLDQIRKERGNREMLNSIPQMENFLKRIDIKVNDLDKLNVVHVSGTKGKGSTCAFSESILRHCGLNTGFYSSPHLVEVRERMRINGKPLDKDKFVKYFWQVMDKLEATLIENDGEMPAYFRFLTLLSYHVFLQEQVDVAVIEVGIGGAHDCTNVIRNPVVCGIAMLGVEHTLSLGDTIQKIAWHKAGIMKTGHPAVTIPQVEEVYPVFKESQHDIKAELFMAPPLQTYENDLPVIGLEGTHQQYNASLALQLCRIWLSKKKNFLLSNGLSHLAGLIEPRDETKIDEKSGLPVAPPFFIPQPFMEGIRRVKWPGRNQVVQRKNVTFYLDGAHTAESVRACSDWFSARKDLDINIPREDVFRVLVFNSTGARDAHTLLRPISSIDFDFAVFCPNVLESNNNQPSRWHSYKGIIDTTYDILRVHYNLKMDKANHTAKDEAMRYEIEVFKEKKKLATRRLKQLLKQKNQLCTLNDSLLEKVHKVDASLQEINDSFLENTNHVNAGNEQVAKNLEILNRQVEHALSIHRDSSAQATESFPSRVAPRDYFQAEEEFTSSLTAYTKRQFFEGIADMAGSKDKLRYEILEVSKPESLLIRGESEEVLQFKCEEMRRLQSIYTDNQKVKFESHCNLRRIQASLYKTEDIISKLSIEPPTLDVDILSSKIADLQRKCEEKSREVKKIFDDKLIPLIEEMSELQTTKVLSGNFDLKIARQDYFTSKQDAVIDQLLLQNSRYEFLSMLYEVEAKCHRDTYNLLSTAKSILARDQKALEKRLSLMLPHTEEKPARETIDSRDFFVQNLFKAFDKDDSQASKRHFITCGMLKQNFEDFMINVRKQDNASGSADGNDVAPLDNARRQLADCTSMILGIERESQSDAFGEEMSEKISKIDDVLVTVEKSVKSAISEIDRKKKLLASDSLKALERTLFTNFFNDPSRMKRIVTELKTRVEAMER